MVEKYSYDYYLVFARVGLATTSSVGGERKHLGTHMYYRLVSIDAAATTWMGYGVFRQINEFFS